jgi:hypothetical protein
VGNRYSTHVITWVKCKVRGWSTGPDTVRR